MFWNLNERFFYIFSICERLPVPDYFLSGNRTITCTLNCWLHPLLEVIFAQISLLCQFRVSHLHLDIFEQRLRVYSGNVLTFDFLLLASFSLHIKHTGEPVSHWTSVFFRHVGVEKLKKLQTDACRTSEVVTCIKSNKNILTRFI